MTKTTTTKKTATTTNNDESENPDEAGGSTVLPPALPIPHRDLLLLSLSHMGLLHTDPAFWHPESLYAAIGGAHQSAY